MVLPLHLVYSRSVAPGVVLTAPQQYSRSLGSSWAYGTPFVALSLWFLPLHPTHLACLLVCPLGLLLPIQLPRSTHDLVAMDGWLYAVGGNDGSSSLNSIEKYNPRTNKWVAASCMFTRRSSVGVAVLELLNFPPPSSPTLSVSSTSL